MESRVMLNENIYWIGKIDDRDVPFHRLTLTKGTTYNSYLLMAEKPTVIDTVDISFGREFIENLKSLIDLDRIEYIVINHTEPDHSGGLGALAARAKKAIIVCTEPAVNELKEMYKLHDRKFLVVKDGDTLDIGGKTLRFIETPYLHTEETMVTYCEEDKILFPCDIFSTHAANYKYFNDLAEEDITEDFITYYKLIMHPHRRYVREMIGKIKDLEIDMIAPSHGFIIRQDVNKFIEIYDEMSKNTDKDKKAVIVYSAMGGNTRKIAEILQQGFEESGINVEVMNIKKFSKEEVLEKIKEADAVLFGSSTRYGDMIGKLEDILKELKNMNLEGKVAAAFGSYGWSGEAIEVIQDYINTTTMKALNTSEIIKSTGMTDIHFPLRIRFSPKEEDIKKIKRAAIFTSELILAP
ncbi:MULTISPECIES: FprA family A-type flavoprotein [Clostridium]|uniref:Anaerobic nitric oxide reductase flavorubredoxin n=2 Tax=Clostridium TaxID=1485 RepID=A0A151AL07_9CLOT|nr:MULTISPECIES: FprA family A-type flavoprotein [Clostridium]KYH28298.1 anaerobic nitric oxide reductase flavorubredoxin [Clostridium colicanis DSM 13634]PRR74304.1 Anaerobic nitric oxide reductase flavorubredoxin [Clostridium thermopalmarium DSM 5974]PVZ22092.1 flavorubredoxin [Clostridium thermopalmarium DSM 5974]